MASAASPIGVDGSEALTKAVRSWTSSSAHISLPDGRTVDLHRYVVTSTRCRPVKLRWASIAGRAGSSARPSKAMDDDATDLTLSHPTRHNQRLVAGYIFVGYLINVSNRARAEKWQKIRELTELTYNWRFARFWKFRTRIKSMTSLMTLLKKYSAG